MADVFISYSRKDIAFAHLLVDALKTNGLETWIDWEDIPPSADWLAEILRAIEQADTFVYIVSQHSKDSQVCSQEVQHAIANQKRLVPIVIQPEIGPDELPERIAALNWIFFPDCAQAGHEAVAFERGMAQLLAAIKTDLAWVKAHTRLQVRALAWQNHQGETSFALRGSELSEAEAWLAQVTEAKEPQPTVLQRQYVLASRKDAERRQRITLAAVFAGMLIAIVLAVIALRQSRLATDNAALAQANAQAEAQARQTAVAEAFTRATAEANAIHQRATAEAASTEAVAQRDEAQRQAKLALAGKLAAQSQLLIEDQLDLGLLLSVEASQAANTTEAALSPRLALEYSPRLLHILHSSRAARRPFAISPDGKTLAAAECTAANDALIGPNCEQGRVVFYDLLSGRPTGAALDLGAFSAGALAYNRLDGGQTLVLVGYHSIATWDLSSGALVSETPSGQQETRYYPTSVAFSPDGKFLAIGSCADRSKGSDANGYCNLGEIRIWDIQKSELAGQPAPAHASDVHALAFSPDSRVLASAGDETIKLWAISTRPEAIGVELSGEAIQAGDTVIDALAFSPDGALLAAGGSGSRITLWDTAARQPSGDPLQGHSYWISALQFSPDGGALASGSWDDRLILWDLAERQAIGQALVGHAGDVVDLSFDPQGGRLVSGDPNGMLLVWHSGMQFSGSPLGEQLANGEGAPTYSGFVWTHAFSPDGKTLAYAINDKIYLWDIVNHQQLRAPLAGHRADIRSLVFPPEDEGRTLLSASRDAATILWEVASGAIVAQTGQDLGQTINQSAFSQDGLSLGYLAKDGRLRIVNLPDGTLRQEISLPPEDGRIYNFALSGAAGPAAGSVCESPPGSQPCSGFAIVTWEAGGDRPGEVVIRGLEAVPPALALSPDGQWLAYAVRQSGRIVVVERQGGNPVSELLLPAGETFDAQALVFSPDGSLLAASYPSGNKIILWETASGRQVGEPFLEQYNTARPAFSPDGKLLAWALDGAPFLWDIAGQKALGQPLAPGDAGGSLAFSPDGQHVLVGGSLSSQAQVFEAASGSPAGEILDGHVAPVVNLAFAADGGQLFTLSQEGTLNVWDTAGGSLAGSLMQGYLANYARVDLSRDGRQMALAACKVKPGSECLQSELWLQDNASGKLALQPLDLLGGVTSVRFSHAGRLLALGGDSEVIVWDVAAQAVVARIQNGESAPDALAFSPDDAVLAVKAGEIRLWNLADGAPAGAPILDRTTNSAGESLAGTQAGGLAFSPDGRYLATVGSGSGSLLLVEVSSGRPSGGLLLDPRNQLTQGMLISVAFSPDGKTLVSGNNGGVAILWQIDPAAWGELACAVAGRNLTGAEWAAYLPGAGSYRGTCP